MELCKECISINKQLDSENYDSNEMSKKIVECWIDKKFGEEMRTIIIDLLELSKKFEKITDYADNAISDNMYEMF